jgi:hypothetical protein
MRISAVKKQMYHSKRVNRRQIPIQIPPTVVLTHPQNLNLPQIKGGYRTHRMMIMIRPRFGPTCSARKRSLRKRRRNGEGGRVDEVQRRQPSQHVSRT